MGSILACRAKVECQSPLNAGKKVVCNTCGTEVSKVSLKCAYCQDRFPMWKGNCNCPLPKLCGYCQLASNAVVFSEIHARLKGEIA